MTILYRWLRSHLLLLLSLGILCSLSINAATIIRANQINLADVFAFTGNNTHAGTETFSVQTVITAAANQLLMGASPNQTTLNWPAPSGNVTLTFPNTTDTMVGRATVDTMSNKTFSASPTITGGLTVPNGGTGQTVASTFSASAGAYPILVACGATVTCANSAQGTTARIIFGSCPFSSATTCTVASITAFTSSSSYFCQVVEAGNTGLTFKVANVSSSSFTITASSSNSDAVNYLCAGN